MSSQSSQGLTDSAMSSAHSLQEDVVFQINLFSYLWHETALQACLLRLFRAPSSSKHNTGSSSCLLAPGMAFSEPGSLHADLETFLVFWGLGEII